MRPPAILAVIQVLLLFFSLAGCAREGSPPVGGPGSGAPSKTNPGQGVATPGQGQQVNGQIKVLTTISIFADFAREVGNEKVTVRSMIPAGIDPHTFQPTPQDAKDISEADVILINGLGLEGQVENLVRATMSPNAQLVVLSEGLTPISDEFSERGQGQGNPHLWLDAQNAMTYVENINAAFGRADPEDAAYYAENTQTYLGQLTTLDRWIFQQIETIPAQNRKLVTFHDAFPYYAKRYGLDLVGVVLRSPGSEPSAKEVADLVGKIESEGVRTIFTEPQFNPQVMQVVAQEAGVSVAVLYSDSTGGGINTYEEMMRFDTNEIVNGLR